MAGKGDESAARKRARRVLEIEAGAVAALIERVGPELDRAVEILAETSGKVVLSGLGKSGIIARKVAATMASTGTPAFFLHAGEGIHGDLGMVMKGDSVVLVSYSGETQEIVGMLPLFKFLGLPTIALTGEPGSTLGKSVDVVLDVSVKEEACSLALAPTASTTAALAMGDALAVVLSERRGFREEEFAFLHPGGSLGKKLLRVADLMHRGPRMPLVGESATLGEAIAEMTGKGLGVTGVVDPAGVLAGILTDGDLRRLLQRGTAAAEARVAGVMTRSPKTIGEEALGAEAVAVMERHAITTLFIVDGARRPRGIIHLHDLLRAGIV
jgi:arabinose-5-phosphate isomerase